MTQTWLCRWLFGTRPPPHSASPAPPSSPEPNTPPEPMPPPEPAPPVHIPPAVPIVSPKKEEETVVPVKPPPPRTMHTGKDPVPGPYGSDEEYLNDELTRVDYLIKAYLLWRKSAQIVEARASEGRPEYQVADALLSRRFGWNEPVVDPDCDKEISRLLDLAHKQEEHILRSLHATPERDWGFLRLLHLIYSFDLAPGWYEAVRSCSPGTRDTVSLDVLLICLLVARSPRYRVVFFSETGSQGGVTAEVLLQVVALQTSAPGVSPRELRWETLAPCGILLVNRLIVMEEVGPLAGRLAYIDERVADFLLGKDTIDPTLVKAVQHLRESVEWDRVFLDPVTLCGLQRLSDWWWRERTKGSAHLVLLLHGPAGSPFKTAAQAFLTRETYTALLVVDVAEGLARGGDWDDFVRRCYREAMQRNSALFWRNAELLLATGQPAGRWESLIKQAERSMMPTFIASETPWDPTEAFHRSCRYFVRMEFWAPSGEMRRKIWLDRLAREKNPIVCQETSEQRAALDMLESFHLTEGQIDDVLATARGLALAARPDHPLPNADELAEGCRRQSARRLVSFAQRIPPRPDLADLKRVVLPEGAAQQLAEMADRMKYLQTVHHRLGFEQRLCLGRGLIALFTGPSGTGKTMAAMVLASVNRKDLYKVDMASVVSKFVGETEKNLNRVFADAQDANAVLFFDEADALFGKRGEVEQAQDRWANLEVNFLLQRVEEFSGTVILATNFRQNIDEAFLRRVQVLINFPLPNATHRLEIFKGMFPDPTRAPLPVIPPVEAQLKVLADRFELSGGSIKNVVLDAAFRTVARLNGTRPLPEKCIEVKQDSLVLGVAREYQKLGKPITIAEFGRDFFELVTRELKLTRGS